MTFVLWRALHLVPISPEAMSIIYIAQERRGEERGGEHTEGKQSERETGKNNQPEKKTTE